ncbi:hypothetical protein BH09PAT2_BH09PAT2_10960 [soil metagenome]
MTLPRELTTVTLFSKILAAIFFITLPFIGFLLGVNYQVNKQMSLQSQPNQNLLVPTKTNPLAPLPTKVLSISDINIFKMPSKGTVLEICDYPWDYEPATEPSQGYEECVKFEEDGTLRKEFYSPFSTVPLLLSSNKYESIEEKVKVKAKIQSIYTEITAEEYIEWLETSRMPALGPNPDIRIHSQDSDFHETVTSYMWGVDSADGSMRLREIFAELKALAPPPQLQQ